MMKTLARAAVILAAASATAGAQGTISSQALGYPPGELSTRAQGTGGAFGDMDPRSPINPAAVAGRSGTQVFMQYDPELRTLTGPNGSSSTTTARFPNVGLLLPAGSHLTFGASASTLLDRSWATQSTRVETFGPDPSDTTSSTRTLRSDGGITDLRLAAAYALNARVRFGIAFHGYTGSDRVTASNIFPDTLRYRTVTQVSDLAFTGTAVAAGLDVEMPGNFEVAVSGQKGGTARMYAGDTVLATAHAPDRYSGSIAFTGLPGTVIAVRGGRELWSRMAGLSTTGAPAVDANEISAGLESFGPRIGGYPILVRLGARRRTLPFPVVTATGTSDVQETSFGGGLGIPIAFDRVTLDISALRSSRTGVAGISEHAYNLSFGLQVHP